MDKSKAMDGEGGVFVERLTHIEARLDEMRQMLLDLSGKVEQVNQRASSALYMDIIGKMAPQLLPYLVPQVEGLEVSSKWDLSGYAQGGGPKWLRTSAGRALMWLGTSLSAIPFSKRREFMLQALELTERDELALLYGRYLNILLSRGGYTWADMLPECRRFESAVSHVRNANCPYAWMVCLAANGEAGCDADVVRLFREGRKRSDLSPEMLYEIPLAAYHARRCGVAVRESDVAADLIDMSLRARRNGSLRQAFCRRRVAIVGGGPQERGKGKGTEIDDHDTVIRINHLPGEEHWGDYGRKTDIFVFGEMATIPDHLPSGLEILWLLPGFSWHRWELHDLRRLYDIVTERGITLVASSQEDIAAVIDPEIYSQYTGGLLVMALVKRESGFLREKSLYGFHHSNPEVKEYSHYTSAEGASSWAHKDPMASYHNLLLEKKCYRDLLAK